MASSADSSADERPLQLLEELGDLHPDGLVVADGRNVVRYVNAPVLRITGRDRAAMLGRPLGDALPLQDTDGRAWWSCADPFHGLNIRTGHREQLLLLPGGPELLVTAKYLRPGRGQPVHAVVVAVRDAEARRRAEASNAALISTVAHELRSPLTSVKGFSSTLLRRWGRFTDDQKRLMLQTIEADADRVTRLITELLDVSRIDAGRLQVRKQPVDVPGAVRRHIERLVASGNERDRFELVVDPGLPETWADPDRLDQILGNLMENAVRHGDGTVSLSVMKSASEGPGGSDALAVTVSDQGEGIAPENYPLVFTRFWHGSRRGGTGLGLYVVRGLVEAHGGRISVGRAPGGGAQFRFTLPSGAPEHLI